MEVFEIWSSWTWSKQPGDWPDWLLFVTTSLTLIAIAAQAWLTRRAVVQNQAAVTAMKENAEAANRSALAAETALLEARREREEERARRRNPAISEIQSALGRVRALRLSTTGVPISLVNEDFLSASRDSAYAAPDLHPTMKGLEAILRTLESTWGLFATSEKGFGRNSEQTRSFHKLVIDSIGEVEELIISTLAELGSPVSSEGIQRSNELMAAAAQTKHEIEKALAELRGRFSF